MIESEVVSKKTNPAEEKKKSKKESSAAEGVRLLAGQEEEGVGKHHPERGDGDADEDRPAVPMQELLVHLPPGVPGHGVTDREASSPSITSLSWHVECWMIQTRLTQHQELDSDFKMKVSVTQNSNVIDYSTISNECHIVCLYLEFFSGDPAGLVNAAPLTNKFAQP